MLRELLTNLVSPAGVTRLFVYLGYTAEHQADTVSPVIVARWKGFRIYAITGPHPRDAARTFASQLAKSCERALVVGLAPSREIALVAPRLGSSATSRVLVVPLDTPPAHAINHLESFRPKPGSSGLAHALRVDELLASELAGERFFGAFSAIHEQMTACLQSSATREDRRLAALLAMTRVLFLYFVQAKGWLDGRHDYLRVHLDDCLTSKTSFHRHFLDPLVFEILNKPPSARTRTHRFGAIPYLNGGLFERHAVEHRVGSIEFPNAQWRTAFDELFERYRFCVREAHEVDAIAPDMLGHVFERLMEGDARHSTGTFYTPEHLVKQIVAATLKTTLHDRFAVPARIVDQLEHRELRLSPREIALITRALEQIRLLDPAVGSGAFLLSALDLLTQWRCGLYGQDVTMTTRLQVRRKVLGENLFGVDTNPTAVRLAELRLWLAMVADDPTEDVRRVEPLPNLDGVVRQGDSLLDPLGAARALGLHPANLPTGAARAVQRQRGAVFCSHAGKQRESLRALQSAERTLAINLLSKAGDKTDAALKNLISAARGRDLFGGRRGLDASEQRDHHALRRQHTQIRQARKAVADGQLPFFSYEVHTPDVIRAGGFTTVVGNPPWVRAERLDATVRRALKERFSWWKASATGPGYAHLPDLSVAFLQRALELTAPGGAAGLLVPSKIVTANYAQAARTHLARETTLRFVHRVADRQADFKATTYPLALIVSKKTPARSHRVRLDFSGGRSTRQRLLVDRGPWILVSDTTREALDELRRSGQPLGQVSAASLGVKTGANDILVGRVLAQQGACSTVRFKNEIVKLESAVLRSAIRGRDISPFGANPEMVVVWGYPRDGLTHAPIPDRLREYVTRHRKTLIGRADYDKGPPWQLFRLTAATAQHRVIWPDIARRPTAVSLHRGDLQNALPINSCYVSSAPDADTMHLITAVLNSTWSHALVSAVADEARGGYLRVNRRATADIPIPQPSSATDRLIRLSYQAHHDQLSNQDELDDAVAEALCLSPRTRASLRTFADHHRRRVASG